MREPEPVLAGDVLIFPDFALQHRHDGRRWLLEMLSSRPDQVSGGDTLVRVDVPRTVPLGQVTITRNGVDVTDKFSRASDGRALFSFE